MKNLVTLFSLAHTYEGMGLKVCPLHSFEVTGSTSYFLMVLECTICTNTSLIS